MRAVALVSSLVTSLLATTLVGTPAAAQFDAASVRRAARDAGLTATQSTRYGHPREVWCRPDQIHEGVCDDSEASRAGPRIELSIVSDVLVELHARIPDAVASLDLDLGWQATGQFTFRFQDGADLVDLGYAAYFEHPSLAVGFTSSGLDADTGGELGRLLASSASLQRSASAMRTRLRANVERGLTSSATVRDRPLSECLEERDTPTGHGWFVTCPHRPATAEEVRAVLGDLDARLAREATLLSRHADAMHAVLVRVLGVR